MAYNATSWSTGDTITAAALNKLEAGVSASAVVADLGTSGTATGDALKAAVARVPAHAGTTRAGYYDASRSIYNLKASNTRRLRAALGAARAGTGLARLWFIGDSLTAGTGSTRGTTDAVSLLRQELTRQSYNVGELVSVFTNGVADSRWSPGPSLTGTSKVFPWGSFTGTASVVSGTGTVFEVVLSSFSGSITVSIDGGGGQVLTANSSGSRVQLLTLTGLSNAAHTASITGSGTPYVHAAGFRQATGVCFANDGTSGSVTGEWITNTTNFGPLDSYQNDAAFIELGINDWNTAVSISEFSTNLQGIVDTVKATGATVVLVTSNYPSGGDTTWPAYVSAIYDVADSRDVPLIDFADRLGLYSQYNADGQVYDEASDTLHLTPAGYAHKARAWWNALAT